MKLTLCKSDWIDDWYLIERAEHDHTQGYVQVHPQRFELQCSSRFSDADVEGTAREMLDIATAIEQRGRVRFKRCAVRVDGEAVLFSSPRNSQREGVCSLAEADELARLIREICKAPTEAQGPATHD